MIFCIAFTSHAQNVIRGTVLDEGNQPVVGATVAIRATGAGTITDADGKFSISTGKALPLTLTVSYLGFKTREITAASVQEPLNIRLAESTNQLDETVVVGLNQFWMAADPLDANLFKRSGKFERYDSLSLLRGIRGK